MPEADLTGRQLDLIAHLAALQPPMFLMAKRLLIAREDHVHVLVRARDAARQERVLGVPAQRLSDDMFDQPPTHLEGIAVNVISPLALYQIRAGVARRNSFAPLSARQLATMAELRERFFPDRSEEQLLPPSEPLPG